MRTDGRTDGLTFMQYVFQITDIWFFLCILGVFMASYGIPSYALRFPNGPLSFEGLVLPYWQMYGELALDVVAGMGCYIYIQYIIYYLVTYRYGHVVMLFHTRQICFQTLVAISNFCLFCNKTWLFIQQLLFTDS